MLLFLQRWLFFVLGGAVFTPYVLLAIVGLPLAVPSLAQVGTLPLLALVLVVVVSVIAASSFVPVIRTIESAAVPVLLGGEARDLVIGPARTGQARTRNMVWYLLHTVVGAVVSVLTVTTVPIGLGLAFGALGSGSEVTLGLGELAVPRVWAVPVSLGMLAGLLMVVYVVGWGAARLAPPLLGPDPQERIAELERRTSMLTERTRLARELHDSIGHALTVTTLQASAARKVLHTDPAFAEQALEAIEQTGRVATADLDNFLGLLREEAGARRPQLTLRDVDALVRSHRQSGLPIELALTGDETTVPPVVSREVYRIVQEGLTNVHRHAGLVRTTVQVSIDTTELGVVIENERGVPVVKTGGGRGLAGMRERVQLLGGRLQAADTGSGWRLDVVVPTGAAR